MKESLYSLEDKGYCFLMQKLGEVLIERQIPHAVVGGAAAQLRVVEMVCDHEKKPLEDVILAEEVSERKNLRRTNDIDIIIHDKPEVVSGVINDMLGETFTKNHIYIIRPSRIGQKRPKILIEVMNGYTNSSPIEIALNISYSPKDLQRLFAGNYYPVLHDAETVNFNYEDLNPKIRVAKPEHIIATKLARYASKDLFDIFALVDLCIKYRKLLNMSEIEGALGKDKVEFIERLELFKAELEHRQKEFKAKKIVL